MVEQRAVLIVSFSTTMTSLMPLMIKKGKSTLFVSFIPHLCEGYMRDSGSQGLSPLFHIFELFGDYVALSTVYDLTSVAVLYDLFYSTTVVTLYLLAFIDSNNFQCQKSHV